MSNQFIQLSGQTQYAKASEWQAKQEQRVKELASRLIGFQRRYDIGHPVHTAHFRIMSVLLSISESECEQIRQELLAIADEATEWIKIEKWMKREPIYYNKAFYASMYYTSSGSELNLNSMYAIVAVAERLAQELKEHRSVPIPIPIPYTQKLQSNQQNKQKEIIEQTIRTEQTIQTVKTVTHQANPQNQAQEQEVLQIEHKQIEQTVTKRLYEERREVAKKGKQKQQENSIKEQFRRQEFIKLWQQWKTRLDERGGKAKFYRFIQEKYSDFVCNNADISDRDSVLSEDTIRRWVKNAQSEKL